MAYSYSTSSYTHSTAGQDAFEKGDMEKAKKELNLALKTWKSRDKKEIKIQAYSTLALIDMSDRNYENALNKFQEVLKLEPKDGRTHYRIGLIYSVQNKNNEAIEEMKKSIELDPKFVMSLRTLGDLYRKIQYPLSAIEYYARVTVLNATSDSAYAGIGESYRMMGQYDKATGFLQTAVSINPNNAIAYYTLGVCHSKLEKYQDAIEDFQHALSAKVLITSALKVQIYTFLNEAYEKIGQKEKADEAIQKAKSILDSIPLDQEK